MNKVTFPISSLTPKRYSFGYSATDDINTVENWQEANNVFEDVPFGTWYFFAKLKILGKVKHLRRKVVVKDKDCVITAAGFRNITPQCRLSALGFRNITSSATFRFSAITAYNVAEENLTCEILSNPHTQIAEALARAQHHYAIVAESVMAGTVFSEGGQVSKDGGATWTNLTELGFDALGRRFAGYKLPYTVPVNPLLRTKDGCTSYNDARLTEYFTANMAYKTALAPSDSPSPGNFDLNGILIASHLDSRQATQGNADVYVIWLAGHGQSYKIRINSGAWLNGIEENIIPSKNGTPVVNLNIPVTTFSVQNSYPKDFVLDITRDGGTTYDRYVVRRWSTGGHYSTVCAITRMRDNKVYACTTNGDVAVPSYLRIGATTYPSTAAFGCSYDLGVLSADAVATFGFTDTATDWADVQLLIDNYQ